MTLTEDDRTAKTSAVMAARTATPGLLGTTVLHPPPNRSLRFASRRLADLGCSVPHPYDSDAGQAQGCQNQHDPYPRSQPRRARHAQPGR